MSNANYQINVDGPPSQVRDTLCYVIARALADCQLPVGQADPSVPTNHIAALVGYRNRLQRNNEKVELLAYPEKQPPLAMPSKTKKGPLDDDELLLLIRRVMALDQSNDDEGYELTAQNLYSLLFRFNLNDLYERLSNAAFGPDADVESKIQYRVLQQALGVLGIAEDEVGLAGSRRHLRRNLDRDGI